jgi:hypothetical protein
LQKCAELGWCRNNCALHWNERKKKESAGKPGSVVDSHSSRPGVAARLEQPTREQRGPRQCSPIWSCSGWGLPCHAALSPHAVRSYRTVSPLPDPLRAIGGLFSVALSVGSRRPGVTWHPALWSPDFPRGACAPRDCLADSAASLARMRDKRAAKPATAPHRGQTLHPQTGSLAHPDVAAPSSSLNRSRTRVARRKVCRSAG